MNHTKIKIWADITPILERKFIENRIKGSRTISLLTELRFLYIKKLLP